MRQVGALQEMLLAADLETEADEIHEGGRRRHLRQARIVAHQQFTATADTEIGAFRLGAVGQQIKVRFGDDAVAKLAHLRIFDRVGALGN